MESQPPRTLVLWDGECGLCGRCASWAERKDRRQRLELTPFQKAPRPPMTDALYEACHRDMHAILPDGSVLRGGDAALHVLSHFRGWRILARILKLPPMIWLVRVGYRVVADHRTFWSRLLFRKQRDIGS